MTFHPESRRHFLGQVAAGSVSLLASNIATASTNGLKIDNPYDAVVWDQVNHVGSGSHIHAREQKSLDNLHRRGLTHLAISNYYPSVPCSSDERRNQYHVEQLFATSAQGERRPGPFRWNEIIMDPETGWHDELPEKLRGSLPFRVGEPIFSNVPQDVIICPNAEHHGMTDIGAHVNGLGSRFKSGNFDARGLYLLPKHGYPVGVRLPWRDTFRAILAELQFDDGGGITINHPRWSRLTDEQVTPMLDFDQRILGIEIWNHTCEDLNGLGWALDTWDRILSTGRRCFGFSVSDHRHRSEADFLGYNVLLVDQKTPPNKLSHACLQAYRGGQFYCTLVGRLRFESINVEAGRVEVTTNLPCRLSFHTAVGKVLESSGTSAEWEVPNEMAERLRAVYVRVEAHELDGKDAIFSQPIRFV